MNLPEYQIALGKLNEAISVDKSEKIIYSNANTLLATIKNRIQRLGKDSDDNKMSLYSSNPSYYTRNQFVKKGAFKPKGKTGKSNFKNGASHKSMYLEHGYKEFREIQGRSTDKRDLTLSGETMLSYTIGTSENYIVLGLDSTRAMKIREGQEKRNGGKIFTATKQEMDDYSKGVIRSYIEEANRIFNG